MINIAVTSPFQLLNINRFDNTATSKITNFLNECNSHMKTLSNITHYDIACLQCICTSKYKQERSQIPKLKILIIVKIPTHCLKREINNLNLLYPIHLVFGALNRPFLVHLTTNFFTNKDKLCLLLILQQSQSLRCIQNQDRERENNILLY